MTQQTTFEQIQSLCRDFRRQLRSGAQKRIEDYLDRVYEDSREMLFQNLLHIDIEFQRRKGHEPSSNDYIQRFPDYGNLIRQAFFESTMMSADPAAETPAEQRTELEDVPPGRKLGEYELLRQIGRGAFGAVYKAKHLQRGDTVALKLLPLAIDGNTDASGDADRLHKFRREFRALSDVNHPNLVGMQSLEVDGRQWFFTMDLVEGTDFLDYVRPGGTVDISRLKNAARQLAEGLAALHRRHIVHRDLKPANVMVDHEGHVSILDFGLVIEGQPRADFTVLMSTHGFAGTPLYAAPEQMFGDCDAASDWYAVGVMLYEALTGKPPFRGSGADLMRTKSATDAPQLRGQTGVPDDLGQLVDDLLQRDPERRPTGESVLDRLGVATEITIHDSTESLSDSVGSGSQPSLIGRDAELKSLKTRHQHLQKHREPVAVFVKGRSGEGKTSLAEEFLRAIRTDGGTLVLAGRCYDRESVPFKAIDAVIDSLVLFLRSRPDDEVRSWLPDDIGMLAQLFPMLRRVSAIGERIVARSEVRDTRQLRHRAFAALRDLLTAIGAATPVILFVDDVQWGDGDSATALRDVLQPPQAPAVMLLGTYRSDEAADSAFLREWTDYTSMTDDQLSQHEVEVGPLSEAQCLSLLAVRLGTDPEALRQQAQQLFEGTQGNPYFLEQLLEGFDAQTGRVEAVPLADVIERRLQRLPPPARSLLKAIAVAGQAVALPEAAAVAGQSNAAMSTITHMRNERLVRLIGAGEDSTVDTYHDKIRETVLAKLPGEERRRLHLQFAEQLIVAETLTPNQATDWLHDDEALAESATITTSRLFDIAHHLEHAQDERAFVYHLVAGAVSLAAYGMETALEHLQTADRLKPPDVEPRLRYRLTLLLGKALASRNRLEDAMQHYRAALPDASSSAERAECRFAISVIHWQWGEYTDADRNVRQGLAEMNERLPKTVFGSLLATSWAFTLFHLVPTLFMRRLRRMSQRELTTLCRFFTEAGTVLAQTDLKNLFYLKIRSSVIARQVHDEAVRAESYSSYAGVLGLAGIPWLSSRVMGQADVIENGMSSQHRTGIIDCYRGMHAYTTGRLEDAENSLELAVERLSRCGDFRETFARHFAWHCWSYRGPTAPLLHHAVAEARIGLQTGDRITLAYGRYGMAEAISKRGDCAAGLQLAKAAVSGLTSVNAAFLCVGYVQLARVQNQAGDYDGARQSAWNAIRDVPKFRLVEISAPAFALYVEAIIADRWRDGTSRVSRRNLWKARFVSLAARFCGWIFPTCRSSALRVSGRLSAATCRRRKARRFFEKAINAARAREMHYDHARSLIDRSMLGDSDARTDRNQGLNLLQMIECVPPVTEQKDLGITNTDIFEIPADTDMLALKAVFPVTKQPQPDGT